ncbi:uncharacterized protein DSM5745_10500 [Aspergillus mulundensis]|uniref:homogentisate 1,2-dioxygenase n=1 Tax=Aspergillus mulundensis TaxID=1810919 RepID=A0A3D8QJE2_9EURO|nr:hypothetical protein DSM5745_10500 [Aspergillus mulundensis]RDW61828.1 hypothetical protein DSM5745_10500 [Aspergillus mulundensis]
MPPSVPPPSLRKAFHFTDLGTRKPTRPTDPYEYQAGFGNTFSSEVIPGTLPAAINNPRRTRFGLYTEGLTDSAFVAPRDANFSTFMYRARPAMAHDGYRDSFTHKSNLENCFLPLNAKVQPLTGETDFDPFPIPETDTDFIDGLHTLLGSGDPNLRQGLAQHVYAINTDMDHRALCNSDGQTLITPQLGTLDIQTELGMLYVEPGEFVVIPRGIRFAVRLAAGNGDGSAGAGAGAGAGTGARGFVTEIWGSSWRLPDLGPLGGHALAEPSDFLYPVACIDGLDALHERWTIVTKADGRYMAFEQDHSPFDVVAWRGNVVPYKYDLTKFAPAHSTSVDHIDPSVNTVLTAPSSDPHTPLADFLRFGPRWDATSNTFRPPYFHRNAASEFVGYIYAPGHGHGGRAMHAGGSAKVIVSHTPHGFEAGAVRAEMGVGLEDEAGAKEEREGEGPRKILQGESACLSFVPGVVVALVDANVAAETLMVMVETSRSLLGTEYAVERAGVLKRDFAMNTRARDILKDNFSAYPNIENILARAKADREGRRRQVERFFDDEALQGIAGLE